MTCYIKLFEKVKNPKTNQERFKEKKTIAVGKLEAVRLYSMAKGGIPEADAIRFSFSFNVDIYFEGKNLEKFLKKNYQGIKINIVPNRKYKLSVIVFSKIY